jgi:leucyl-tRNA synthetase
LSEELWSLIKDADDERSVHLCSWPVIDESLFVEKDISLPVSFNGKVRGQVKAKIDDSEEEILRRVIGQDAFKKWLNGKKVIRAIYVKGKILNLVISN